MLDQIDMTTACKEDEGERRKEREMDRGNPGFDKEFVRLMLDLNEDDETREPKRKTTFGYERCSQTPGVLPKARDDRG